MGGFFSQGEAKTKNRLLAASDCRKTLGDDLSLPKIGQTAKLAFA
ncbi:hypothetical protein [Anaerotignum neopropionicum]|nr:hypothetical protein [Anaerotignum neopropionicum]